MRVLVTGGANYIGTHTCIGLLNAGHEVYAVGNDKGIKVSNVILKDKSYAKN